MPKVYIIENEPAALQVLRHMIFQYLPGWTICGESCTVPDGITGIRTSQPDVLFLDIELDEGGTGFEVLDAFPVPSFQVVFCTAHDGFALKAFKYHALQYLLKPLNPDELIVAAQMAEQHMAPVVTYGDQLKSLSTTVRKQQFERMFLPAGDKLIVVQLQEIRHLRSDGNYCYVHLSTGEVFFISKSIKEFEALLPEEQFVRVHQSHMIQLQSVRQVVRSEGLTLVMNDGWEVPVSRRKKEEVLARLGVH
jgi:two-component system, LytTR family, response regulator